MKDKKMHEAEILPSGELIVNERKIGQIEGFRLAAAAGGPAVSQEAKAAIAPLLAQYYDGRAEHFAAAPNGDISIGQDGFVRWLGRLVARLTAGEDILHPHSVLLADETVSPAAREKIAQRVQRFITLHFELAVKPLYDLAGAEALFEKPRFIASKLVEHLGIVPRREIAAEVKELDQEARAALRRLGVRFGVYHIFIPALLKLAPAQALTLLWALKNNAQDKAGYGDIVSYLMAGRTSFAVEEKFGRPFYRLAGYRVLGKRAVRIDMLERCADLIRQAMAWRPDKADMPRPDGAYDGKRFIITQAMLSILGTTPEDMEEILRQLGYVAQPVSEADRHAFLQKNGQGGENMAAVPQAEPVGDWLRAIGEAEAAAAALPQAEPVGPKFAESNHAIMRDAVILLWRYQKRIYNKKPHRKDAHRMDAKSGLHQGRNPAEDKAQTGKTGETAGRSGKHVPAERRKAAAAGKFAAAIEGDASGSAGGGRERRNAPGQAEHKKQNGYGGRPKRDFGKPRNFEDKKRNKPVNIEDSPFAALAALRDKMRK